MFITFTELYLSDVVLTCIFWQSAGKGVDGQPSHGVTLPPVKPSSEAKNVLSSNITPAKSVVSESKVESPHLSPVKQKPEMEVKPSGKSTAESAASGSEDILDVLHLRIDQLAASDSDDDLFSGMFALLTSDTEMYDLLCRTSFFGQV